MYLTDVLDEYVMQQVPEYEDYKFVNIAKEDIEHLDKVRGRGWQARGGGGGGEGRGRGRGAQGSQQSGVVRGALTLNTLTREGTKEAMAA